MQTETMLQLALITASLQVVIQLLGVFKGLIDWKVARENAKSKNKNEKSSNRRKRSKPNKRNIR